MRIVPRFVNMIGEDLDLQALAGGLRTHLKQGEPVGYLRGKALMRDLLVREHGFSELEAEELVDTMEMQGLVHFLGDPNQRSEADSHWDIRTDE
jgi:hypothetical protein